MISEDILLFIWITLVAGHYSASGEINWKCWNYRNTGKFVLGIEIDNVICLLSIEMFVKICIFFQCNVKSTRYAAFFFFFRTEHLNLTNNLQRNCAITLCYVLSLNIQLPCCFLYLCTKKKCRSSITFSTFPTNVNSRCSTTYPTIQRRFFSVTKWYRLQPSSRITSCLIRLLCSCQISE